MCVTISPSSRFPGGSSFSSSCVGPSVGVWGLGEPPPAHLPPPVFPAEFADLRQVPPAVFEEGVVVFGEPHICVTNRMKGAQKTPLARRLDWKDSSPGPTAWKGRPGGLRGASCHVLPEPPPRPCPPQREIQLGEPAMLPVPATGQAAWCRGQIRAPAGCVCVLAVIFPSPAPRNFCKPIFSLAQSGHEVPLHCVTHSVPGVPRAAGESLLQNVFGVCLCGSLRQEVTRVSNAPGWGPEVSRGFASPGARTHCITPKTGLFPCARVIQSKLQYHAQPKCGGGEEGTSPVGIDLFYYRVVQVTQQISNQQKASGQLGASHS